MNAPEPMPVQQSLRGPPGQQGRRARLLALLQGLAVLALMGACGWAGHAWSERRGQEALRQETRHKLDLFAAAVQGVVRRLEHVPGTIQLNPDVLALLRQPESAAVAQRVQAYLQRLNAHVGSHRVAVLDERGTVLAASGPPAVGAGGRGLVGTDLSFSPFFLEALSGRVGRHFAIGVPEGEPGYFVSHPIHDGARVVGVAMIQIGLGAIEDTWSMLGAPALVADGQRVVVLSSEPGWRYTALAPLSDEQRVDIELARLYGGRRIAPFPVALPPSLRVEGTDQEGLLELPGAAEGPRRGTAALAMSRPLDGMDWRVLVFADYKPVRNQAWTQAGLAVLAAGSAGLLWVLVQQRRRILRQKLEARRLLEEANADLERQVARRTAALSEANDRLQAEVREREQAEAHLRKTQAELVHAAKMAVLGQLSTSITHELAQPLGGIRTLSGNAAEFLRRGRVDAVAQNLDHVARLADQMGEIIQPLKGYARKSAPVAQAVDLAQALRSARFLFEPRLKREQVSVTDHTVPGAVTAWCDANRLQQVLVNLLANALDAMEGVPARVLEVSAGHGPGPAADQAGPAPASVPGRQAEQAERAEQAAGTASPGRWVWLQVADSGPGLSAEQLEHLFEPFFTTKAVGSGLGLGLAVSRDIVREFGGEILAFNRPEGGARFLLRMPAPPPSDDPDPIPANDHAP